jgi:hypothetical protein
MANMTFFSSEEEFQKHRYELEFPHIVHIEKNGRTIILENENTIPALQENMIIYHCPNKIAECDGGVEEEKRVTDSLHVENVNQDLVEHYYDEELGRGILIFSGHVYNFEDYFMNKIDGMTHLELPDIANFLGSNKNAISLADGQYLTEVIIHTALNSNIITCLKNCTNSNTTIYYPAGTDISAAQSNLSCIFKPFVQA